MATLTVGIGQQYSTISAAVTASRDGDLILVQAGTYVNDYLSITKNITLQGVGGMVQLAATEYIPNGKALVVADANVTIDHFEFFGARVWDNNGAGIRYEGGALTVTNSYFHDNQNGILGAADSTGAITIANSEFEHNGWGDGRTHNIYIGDIARLTVTDSYFHDAQIGHEIKSRAAVNVITNNRIFDLNGTASYSIDLPNGGVATISGNVIQQGANTDNETIIAFGEEGGLHGSNSITMSNNVVVNDLGYGSMLWDASNSPGTVTGTQVWDVNAGQYLKGGGATISGTTVLGSRPVLDTQAHPFSASAAIPALSTPAIAAGSVNFTGTTGADLSMGSDSADNLDGLAGSDTLYGSGGADFIRGFEDNDRVDGGDGADTINGNIGDDTVTGSSGADITMGGQGDDYVDGGSGDDPHVNGNRGNDVVNGGAGADTVYGGQGNDTVFGGPGDDQLSGDLGDDELFGGAGADRYYYVRGGGEDYLGDFNAAEGDRIYLPTGVTYTVWNDGWWQHIDMSGSDSIYMFMSAGDFSASWIVYY